MNSNPETPKATTRPERVNTATPPAHVLENEQGYVLEVELPGVSRDGLEISVEQGELTVVGRRASATTTGKAVYRESRGLDFRRVFVLDPSIDSARIAAKLDQGVLRLELPKSESMKPRQISVTV